MVLGDLICVHVSQCQPEPLKKNGDMLICTIWACWLGWLAGLAGLGWLAGLAWLLLIDFCL